MTADIAVFSAAYDALAQHLPDVQNRAFLASRITAAVRVAHPPEVIVEALVTDWPDPAVCGKRDAATAVVTAAWRAAQKEKR